MERSGAGEPVLVRPERARRKNIRFSLTGSAIRVALPWIQSSDLAKGRFSPDENTASAFIHKIRKSKNLKYERFTFNYINLNEQHEE